MTRIKLYTGNGVSLSPIYEEGMKESAYTRLVADEGKGITNGAIVTTCIDALTTTIDEWEDCELEEQNEL